MREADRRLGFIKAVAPRLSDERQMGKVRHDVAALLRQRVMALCAGWPADAIRLDACDAPAGAGAFYAKCGFRAVGRATYRGCPFEYFEQLL